MSVNPVASSQAQLAQTVSKARSDATLVEAATKNTSQTSSGQAQANNGVNPTVTSSDGSTVNAQGQTIGSNISVKA